MQRPSGLFHQLGTFDWPGGFLSECGARRVANTEESFMLGWALTFLVVALIAAVLGFGGIAGLSVEIAKIIFFVAVVLFLISALVGVFRGRRTIP
jgi:uncharacterized membrane protein YtjA (UPF0391 family)